MPELKLYVLFIVLLLLLKATMYIYVHSTESAYIQLYMHAHSPQWIIPGTQLGCLRVRGEKNQKTIISEGQKVVIYGFMVKLFQSWCRFSCIV